MSIKDLFTKSPFGSQIVVSSSLKNISDEVESPEYLSEFGKETVRVEPHVDFSKPENFAKYGSAEEYYDKSIKYVYDEYPYDGSLKEKIEWRNGASLLDIYLYDDKYPKSTGYALFSSDGWGTLAGSIVNGYGQPASGDYEYINIKGGPNSVFGSSLGTSSLADVFDSKSNVFDDTVTGSIGPISATRQSNLQTNLNNGVTVEFWLKTGSLDTALTEKQVLFDLWNGNASSSADYGRLRIEIDGTRADSPFMVTVLSGTTGMSTSSVEIGSSLTLNSFSDWQHYAFSFVNSGSDIETKLYVNGALSQTITTGSNIGEIRESLEANIGALVTGTFNPSGDAFANLGSGKLSGSIDEFRFWKTRRTGKQIKRNYFTSDLGGGTNTDTSNLDLGVYYKFNEGITTTSSVDSVVLDYSGRISNGTWTGYPSSNARNTGSAIVSASAGTEDLDPIIRSNHPDVIALQTELRLSGSLWDHENNSSLYYTMPGWIIEEDEGDGTVGDLKKLTQIMGSYFDNLDLLIGELPKLSMPSYPSSSVGHDGDPINVFKVYPHARTAVRSFGLEAPDIFSNADVYEYFRNRNETKQYEEDLYVVKNTIYNNIYNNLTDIYKAKGTEKSFRNLIRCFGVDDKLIRINAYADNTTYKFETKRRADSVTTKAINFNHVDNFAGTVYQYADTSNPNSVSFISGSSAQSLTLEDSFPITLEAEVVFPKKIPRREEGSSFQEYSETTASLFGMHTARASQTTSPTVTDITWAATDNANLQVFAVRDEVNSKDVKFMLTSSAPWPIPELTSSYYQDTYNNQKWNFAVRLKPKGYPQSFASGTVLNDYIVEFYGVNYIADRKINEFIVSGTVSKQTAESFLTSPKRIYVGSHKTNFTGSALQSTDAQITSCRYWFDYVDNAAIQNHAIDPDNFGHPNPSRDSYFRETDLANVQVPEIESLALYWDFQTVTGSDNGSGTPSTFDGKFVVEDVSSGSLDLVGRYNWLGKILKYQHTGRGDGFPINSTSSVENLFLYSGKQQLPEVVFGDDNIRVFNQEETEIFTKETRPTKTYYAFEKSMYQVISDEIINYFGSIVEFNNLVGEPVNRYRQQYKNMNYLRQFFFERVGNIPDLDKFINYYKWIDSALESMLMQLVPATAQVSDGIDNVVESHILERNKYWTKFPTLEFNVPDLTGAAEGINKHLYNWKFGHKPLVGGQSASCFYWKERHERDDAPLSSSNANVNADRNKYLTASLQVLERGYTTPYRYTLEKTKTIHGGINYSENKKTNFYRGINSPHGPVTSIGLPKNELNAFNVDVVGLKDCDDDFIPDELQKTKYAFGTRNGRAPNSGSFDGIKGEIAMPFNILSGSPDLGGYNKSVQTDFLANSQLTNLHSDAYGDRNETPMQGPFTQKYVGGHQSRHVRLNNYDASRVGGDGATTPNNLDGQYTRPEGWRLLLGGGPGGLGAIGLTGPDYGGPYPDQTRYRAWWFREETAKRPVNIRNILQTTASADTHLSGVLQHGSIGNYEKTYQVVQTSGRSTNNFWFNDVATSGSLLPARYATNNPKTTNVHTLFGVRPNHGNKRRGNTFIPGVTTIGASPYIKGLNRNSNLVEPKDGNIPAGSVTKPTVFALPERTKQDAVIVERFSAPGGPEINSLGFLDVAAAEKSVYNALPFRNLSVRGSGSGEDADVLVGGGSIRATDHLGHRRGLRTLHSLHAGQFGGDGTYGTIAAATYISSPSFHKINRNPLFRIKPDVDATADAQFLYGTGSSFDNFFVQHPIPQNDFQYAWISASFSSSKPMGHAHRSGFASGTTAFISAIDFLTSSNLSGASGNPVDFVGLNRFFYVPTGSFNEMSSSAGLLAAGVEGALNTELDFLFADANGEHKTNGYNLYVNRGTAGFTSWKQISNQYHPLVRQMRKNNVVSIIDPHTLRKNVRSNMGYLGYKWGPQGLTNTDAIYGRDLGAKANQDRVALEYREPAIQQKFKTLQFTTYLENSPQGLAFIDATYANQKKYFTNSKLNQNLELNENTDTPADLVLESFNGNTVNKLLNVRYTETVYPAANNVYRSYVRQRSTYANDYWRFHALPRRISKPGNSAMIANGVSPTASMWPLDGPKILDLRFDEITAYGGIKTRAGFVGQKAAMLKGTELDPACGILQNTHTIVHTLGASGSLTPSVSNAERFITASALYARPHTLTIGSSAGAWSAAAANKKWWTGTPGGGGYISGYAVDCGTRPPGTCGMCSPTRADAAIVPFAGFQRWDAGNISGKYPFYDSYSEYVLEMKKLGKDYSIIPEYRMSERVEDYLVNGVDPFNDTAILELTGGLRDQTNSNKSDFYKIYSHSDFMKYFDVTEDKMSDKVSAQAARLKVRCSAMLKLLPYDGFYPATRTVQLATLFSQSYGDNVALTGGHGTVEEAGNAYWRAFLTPFFAPGIMFNTIKSGVAVDFPVLTGSALSSSAITGADASGLTNDNHGTNWLIMNENFDYRVPFEALVDPQAYVKNVTLLDMEPHPSCSLNATASWDGGGDKRYRKAMSNFLAEVPEFFLKDGSFTSFASAPSQNWQFVAGKTYKMRVQMRKSYRSDILRDPALRASGFRILKDQAVIPQIVSGSETFMMYDRPSGFGPPSKGCDILAGGLVIQAGRDGAAVGYGGGSLVGYNAPFTPPYYDGTAWVDLEYTPADPDPTLDEVISGITSSYLRYVGPTNDSYPAGTPWLSAQHGGGSNSPGPQSGVRMNDNANQISSSVNLFGKARYFDSNTNETDERWVIQTKFETPMLNFVDHARGVPSDNLQFWTGDYYNTASGYGYSSGSKSSAAIGMWHHYGRLPTGSEGVFLEIVEHPDYGSKTSTVESLADALNFPKDSQRLGTPAETKNIKEAVVAVPFYEELTVTKTGHSSNVRKFFEIGKEKIDHILGRNQGGGGASSKSVPSSLPLESTKQMVESMQGYHFPHSMDFINYPDKIQPFVMYIFEFEHELNRQDVTDIWQNLPPRIGRAFNPDSPLGTEEIMQTKEISHDLQAGELLNAPLKSKLQWMVFKVKQKAKKNYYKKSVAASPITQLPSPSEVATTFDPSGIQMGSVVTSKPSISEQISKSPDGIFEILADGAAKGASSKEGGGGRSTEYDVTYNWPYDFFSLVELVKIDQQVQFETSEEYKDPFDRSTPAYTILNVTSANKANPITFVFDADSAQKTFDTSIVQLMVEQFEIGDNSASVIESMSNELGFIDYQDVKPPQTGLSGTTRSTSTKTFTRIFYDPYNNAVTYRLEVGVTKDQSGTATIYKVITKTN